MESKRKRVTIVRTHPRRVPVTPKNPTGVTIVDRYLRRFHGPALSAEGIRSIAPETLRILLNPEGEAKDFTFKEVRQKDLKDPEIAIPMGIRWIFRKKRLAEGKLGRGATPEEIVLECKGLLKSKSDYQQQALKNFREHYAILKKK